MTTTDRVTSEEFDDWRKRIWDEIVALHDAREQYLTLFAHSRERVEMLNFCARWFFGVVQKTVLREIIMGISRLTDKEMARSQENLVLRVLLRDPALETRPEIAKQLETLILAAEAAAKPFRMHRHKYIAHLDHAVAVGDPSSPLPRLTRAEIDDAISAIEAAYNFHGSRIRDSHAFFSVGTTRGADALVDCLETSHRWQLRLKQLKDRPD